MRKILIFVLMFLNTLLSAQTHIEYISEKSDSMALINKSDIDIINKVFNERNILDSLNGINEDIIKKLEQEVIVQDSLIFKQIQVIENNKILVDELEIRNNQTIDKFSKELRTEKRKKISFQTLTGVGIITIILLILL
jgi:hypothetical protein